MWLHIKLLIPHHFAIVHHLINPFQNWIHITFLNIILSIIFVNKLTLFKLITLSLICLQVDKD